MDTYSLCCRAWSSSQGSVKYGKCFYPLLNKKFSVTQVFIIIMHTIINLLWWCACSILQVTSN